MHAENGGWSDWSNWDLCSKTCGGGVTMRHRRCDSPPPDSDGQPCNGVDNEKKTCNTDKCPGTKSVATCQYLLLLNCGSSCVFIRLAVSFSTGDIARMIGLI